MGKAHIDLTQTNGFPDLQFFFELSIIIEPGGCSSMVEHQLPKLRAAGSIPVTRSSDSKDIRG